MSDILVSIIESVADAAAAARARRDQALAQTAVPWRPVVDSAPPAAVSPPQQQAPDPKPAHRAKAAAQPPAPKDEGRIDARRLFADPQSLIRTVIAAEILGPPLALRRQNLWDAPSV